MTLFWILVSILILLAVLVVLWPLLPFNVKKLSVVQLGQSDKNVAIFKQRLAELEEEVAQGKRPANELEAMKLELEKAVLVDVVDEPTQVIPIQVTTASWLGAGVMCLLLAATSLGLYAHFGHSEGLDAYLARNEQASTQLNNRDHMQGGASSMNMAEAAVKLEEKLAGNPEDKRGWSLLAMTYRQLGSFRKSADAFKRLVDLIDKGDPRYAAMLGSYAQSLYIAEGEKTTPEILKIIDEALQLDPLEPSVLSLAGAELFAQNDFQGAIQQWQKALQKAEQPQVEQYLQPAIAAAKERLGMPADKPQPVATVAANGEAAITMRIDIAAELKDQAQAGKTVFIFARPVGGRMPAAATRLQVSDLPTEITLTDAMSPMPTAKLSSFQEVEIIARVSNSGQPMAQPGDLFVTRSPVRVNGQTAPLDLIINQIVGAASEKQSKDPLASVIKTQPGIALRVDIAPELKSQAQASQSVFIFARPVGERMPAAVTRLQVKDLPVEVKLTDAMSPMPTAKLSLLDEVEITARVSNSGQLMAQPGDLYVTRSPIQVKGQVEPLDLIIDQVIAE